jgi:hypothetical protein
VPSAQVKTCVPLAGLFAAGETAVIERVKSRIILRLRCASPAI